MPWILEKNARVWLSNDYKRGNFSSHTTFTGIKQKGYFLIQEIKKKLLWITQICFNQLISYFSDFFCNEDSRLNCFNKLL